MKVPTQARFLNFRVVTVCRWTASSFKLFGLHPLMIPGHYYLDFAWKKKKSKKSKSRHFIALFRLSSAFKAAKSLEIMGIIKWNGTRSRKSKETASDGSKKSNKRVITQTKLFHAEVSDRALVGGRIYAVDAMVTLVAISKNAQVARMMLGPSRSSPKDFVSSYMNKLVSKIKVLRKPHPVRLVFVFDGDRCVHFVHFAGMWLFVTV